MKTINNFKNLDTPILSYAIIGALIIGAPITIWYLFIQWADSPQRQTVAVLGYLSLASFLLVRRKYEVLLFALLFFSQFRISLYSIQLAEPAMLQIFFIDIIIILFSLAAIERKERIRLDIVAWLLLFLFIWQTLATLIFTAHFHRSLIYLLWQAKYLVIYILISNMAISEKLAQLLKSAVFYILLIQGVLAVAQLITGSTLGLVVLGEQSTNRLFYVNEGLRVSGTLGGTNSLAGYLAILLVFAVPYLFHWQGLKRYAFFGTGFAALIFALSRAGWLSFIIGSGFTVLALVRSRIIKPTRALFLGVLGILILSVGVAIYFDRIVDRFENKGSIDSAMGRFYQFQLSWPTIERYPLFGIGVGVTEYYGAWNENKKFVQKKIPDVKMGNQPHSCQLQTWIESGTPGFILFMLIFLVVFITALRRYPTVANKDASLLQIGASAAAAAAMIHTSFGTEINQHQIVILFWFMLALARNKSLAKICKKTD